MMPIVFIRHWEAVTRDRDDLKLELFSRRYENHFFIKIFSYVMNFIDAPTYQFTILSNITFFSNLA